MILKKTVYRTAGEVEAISCQIATKEIMFFSLFDFLRQAPEFSACLIYVSLQVPLVFKGCLFEFQPVCWSGIILLSLSGCQGAKEGNWVTLNGNESIKYHNNERNYSFTKRDWWLRPLSVACLCKICLQLFGWLVLCVFSLHYLRLCRHPDLKSDGLAVSECTANFGMHSVGDPDCARLNEEQQPQFWNTNGKFKGLQFCVGSCHVSACST